MFKNVVLPDPDGPTTDTKSPSATSRVASRSAWVSTVSVRYTLVTLRIVSMSSPPTVSVGQFVISTVSTPSKTSVLEMMIVSPSLNPCTISTAFRLYAPVRIARLLAMPSSTR